MIHIIVVTVVVNVMLSKIIPKYWTKVTNVKNLTRMFLINNRIKL